MSNRAYKISTSKGRRVKPLFVGNRRPKTSSPHPWQKREAAAEALRRLIANSGHGGPPLER